MPFGYAPAAVSNDSHALQFFAKTLKRKLHMRCAHHKITVKTTTSGGTVIGFKAFTAKDCVGADVHHAKKGGL